MLPRSVLIVDDEPLVTRALVRMLRGHHVHCAATLAEVVEHARGRSYDVAFFDLSLRDGSGVEAAKLVRATVRILMSGTLPEGPDAVQLEREGYAWLAKPFQLEDVQRLLAANP